MSMVFGRYSLCHCYGFDCGFEDTGFVSRGRWPCFPWVETTSSNHSIFVLFPCLFAHTVAFLHSLV